MSDYTGQKTEFYIDATVQSQYAASPTLRKLVDSFWECLNPEADIKLIYDNMINPDTAIGVGLDVWGRIVAIGREYIAVSDTEPYLGFKPLTGTLNDRLDTFNQAPFYSEVNGLVHLSDPAYRTYIFIKAMINIGDSSLASLNRMCKVMFPNADIQILHVGTMVLRVLIQTQLSSANKTALLSLPWLPAGVGLEMYQVITPTFGFNGSLLQPFNQGTFATYETQEL